MSSDVYFGVSKIIRVYDYLNKITQQHWNYAHNREMFRFWWLTHYDALITLITNKL